MCSSPNRLPAARAAGLPQSIPTALTQSTLSDPSRDFGGKKAFHGQAATVKCFESNVLVRQKLETQGNGNVLVVDGGGSLRWVVDACGWVGGPAACVLVVDGGGSMQCVGTCWVGGWGRSMPARCS